MSYSSALFETDAEGRPLLPAAGEGPASRRPRVARSSDCSTSPASATGSRVLEIGTGWGELALRAARRGATVHSITLSTEQLELANRRVAEAGFADRVEIELCDYRAITTAHPDGSTTRWCRSR